MLGDGTAIVEMAQGQRARPRRPGPAGSARGEHPRDRRAHRRGDRGPGANEVIVGVGGSATTDGGLAAVRGARLVACRGVPVTVACDVTTAFTDAAVGLRAAEGRVRRTGRAPHPPARASSSASTAIAPVSTSPTLESAGAAGGLAGGLAAIGARLEPGFDVVAELVGLEDAFDGAELVVTGEGKLDVDELRRQGRGRRARAGGRCRRRPHAASSSGQVTDEAREEASVLGAVRCSRSPTACGTRARPSRARPCSSRKQRSSWLAAEPGIRSAREMRALSRRRGARARTSAAVRGDRDDRRAFRTSTSTRSGSKASVNRVSVVWSMSVSPARRNAVTRIDVACGPSSSSGRLRCSRTPRSTWAVAPSPTRATMSTRSPSSTPQPSTNGTASSTSRRPAYSPRGGWTNPASWGKSDREQGRASSSVTRPPPVGSPWSGRR